MNEEQLRSALHANNVSATVEIDEGGLVVLKIASYTYDQLLKHHEFDGPALRSFLEGIVGMGRVGLFKAGAEYLIGFKGDIAEVQAAEERSIKEDRISHLKATIPRLQSELAELEMVDSTVNVEN